MAVKQRPAYTEVFLKSSVRIRRDHHENPPRFEVDKSEPGENQVIAIYHAMDRVRMKTSEADWLIAQQVAVKFKQDDFDEFKAAYEEQERANIAGRLKAQNKSPESSGAPQRKTRKAV